MTNLENNSEGIQDNSLADTQMLLGMLSWVKKHSQAREAAQRSQNKIIKLFKENNKEAIAEYNLLYQKHDSNSAIFQVLFAHAKEEGLKDVRFHDLKKIILVNPRGKKKKEQKETVENIPELDNENFKIDSANRQEITDINGIKVKTNDEWDVREYPSWEQLFTQESALRETRKLGKKMPVWWIVYRDIINKKYKWNYQNFLKGEHMVFPGYRGMVNGELYDGDEEFNLRCAKGFYFTGNRTSWSHSKPRWSHGKWNRKYGFSVRCLKTV